MIKAAMEYIQQLSRPSTLELDGRKYSTTNLYPVYDPKPDALSVCTLTSLVGYIKSEIDETWQNNAPLVLVESPMEVCYLGEIKGDFCQRVRLLEARASLPDNFPFGRYYDPETFMIFLQTRIARTADWKEAVELCSSIQIKNGAEISDNGATQEVVIRKGVSLAGRQIIKNPIELAPFRTFREIEQPISQFVLRANDKGELALFEADGGAWRLIAMRSIKDWLEGELAAFDVTILA